MPRLVIAWGLLAAGIGWNASGVFAADAAPAAPTVEIRGSVERAPEGVRLFDEYLTNRMTSVEPLRWDQQWDGVRLDGAGGWTALFDCDAVLDALTYHPERLWVVRLTEWSYYAGCVGESLAKRVKPAVASNFSNHSPLEDVVERLDLLSFRSSFARIDREHLTWLEMPEALHDTWGVFEFESTSMRLETDDWYYRFSLLAAGDWTGDGLEDILVEFYDDGKIATYIAISALVLEAPAPDGPLIAHQGEELLRELLLAERTPVPAPKPRP